MLRSVEKHRLNSNEGEGEKIFKNFMKIDNTNLPPEKVAEMIQERFKL